MSKRYGRRQKKAAALREQQLAKKLELSNSSLVDLRNQNNAVMKCLNGIYKHISELNEFSPLLDDVRVVNENIRNIRRTAMTPSYSNDPHQMIRYAEQIYILNDIVIKHSRQEHFDGMVTNVRLNIPNARDVAAMLRYRVDGATDCEIERISEQVKREVIKVLTEERDSYKN